MSLDQRLSEVVCAPQKNLVVQALLSLFQAMHVRSVDGSQFSEAVDPIDLRSSLSALNAKKFGLGVHSSVEHFGASGTGSFVIAVLYKLKFTSTACSAALAPCSATL